MKYNDAKLKNKTALEVVVGGGGVWVGEEEWKQLTASLIRPVLCCAFLHFLYPSYFISSYEQKESLL